MTDMNENASDAGSKKTLSTPRIMVIGNSHTTAVRVAVKLDAVSDIEVINIATFFEEETGKNKFVRSEIAHLIQPQHIFCTFGGSEHSVFGLIEAPVQFDFVMPDDPDVDKSRDYIAFGLIHATLKRAMKVAFKNLGTILELYNKPVTLICTPPPFREINERAKLPRVFQPQIHAGIAPGKLRLKLHALHSLILRQQCASLGIGFLPPPPNVVDSDGYLKKDFWTADPTHGNAAYGRLVIEQMRNHIDG